MQAMVLFGARRPLEYREWRDPPDPGPHQVLIRVHACGVCRTDLHIVDGELTQPKLPLIPGHEIIGTVARIGPQVDAAEGRRPRRRAVARLDLRRMRLLPQRPRESVRSRARFTGYQIDGGYADYAVADERYCFPIPPRFSDAEAAPLMCAGLIGYRALRLAGEAERVGLYGFGAAAHIAAQVAQLSRSACLCFHQAWRRGRARNSRAGSARSGPAVRTNRRRSRSMPR